MVRTLIDTNVLVYAFSEDPKAARALTVLKEGGVLSVQALSEFARVARRRLAMSWDEIRSALSDIRLLCPEIRTLDISIHENGLRLAETYKLGVFDAMMISAGLVAGCTRMLSEDMHHGLLIDNRLRIENPFLA